MEHYVARYDNGTGYMEWADTPTPNKSQAIREARSPKLAWSSETDVIQVIQPEQGVRGWVEIGEPEKIRIVRYLPQEVFDAVAELEANDR